LRYDRARLGNNSTEKPMGNAKLRAERPLSPHLQIYRPMLTMMMSIAHRVSGAANAIGFLLLAWWLVAISMGPEAYAQVSAFFSSIPGRLLLFLFSWSLIHHMLGGIRHLIWDTGRGLDKVSIEIFAWATIIGSTALTVLVWVVGYWLKGAF
jgi:succinate dehydrogenase / fumarate reductase cytochrome b subunit